MAEDTRSALWASCSGSTWAYWVRVRATLAWPGRCETTFAGSPLAVAGRASAVAATTYDRLRGESQRLGVKLAAAAAGGRTPA